jgi:hypothetical protein
MTKRKNLADVVSDGLFSITGLPGQGVFGSEPYCEFEILVSKQKSDMSKNADEVADAIMRECRDRLQALCIGLLEKMRPDVAVFNSTGIAMLNNAVHGRCDVLVNECAIHVLEECGEFRPARVKHAIGDTAYAGRLGWAKVYVNPGIKPAYAYVMDAVVIDVAHDVKDSGSAIDAMTTVKIGKSGVTKYLLTN